MTSKCVCGHDESFHKGNVTSKGNPPITKKGCTFNPCPCEKFIAEDVLEKIMNEEIREQEDLK